MSRTRPYEPPSDTPSAALRVDHPTRNAPSAAAEPVAPSVPNRLTETPNKKTSIEPSLRLASAYRPLPHLRTEERYEPPWPSAEEP